MSKSPFDRLRSAHENERLGLRLADYIRGLDVEAVRATAEALSDLADLVEVLPDAIEEIENADGAEDRTYLRESALEELDTVVEAINALPGEDDTLLMLAMEVGP